MTKCLNQDCENQVTSVAGRRPRQYCSNNCRQKDWQRKQKEKPAINYVIPTPESFDGAKLDKFAGDEPALFPVLSSKKPQKPKKQGKVPPKDETPVNPPQNDSQRHALWKAGDPKENSGAFYLKYDCNNYDELSKLKK